MKAPVLLFLFILPCGATQAATPSPTGAPVQLQKVEVSATQQQFYNSIDRKVYNVGSDITSATGTASDLLQNVPSLQVDVEGNVSLRGDSGVEILINGKPSSLLARNRAAALESIPASEIERVEIITNPSARFRPDGTAGIINLVMKRTRAPGLAGSVRASIGNEDRANTSITASFNPGRFTLHGSAAVRRESRPSFTSEDRARFDAAGTLLSSTMERSIGTSRPLTTFVRLGADYKPRDTTKLAASLDFQNRDYPRDREEFNLTPDAAGTLTRDYDRRLASRENEDEVELELSLEHAFDRDHELTAELQLGCNEERQENRYTNIVRLPTAGTDEESASVRHTEHDLDLSVDYTRPLGGEARLEFGYEGEREKTDLDFRAARRDARTGMWAADARRTNRFHYTGTVHALYATYGRPFGRFGVLAGLRAEHSIIDMHQITAALPHTNTYTRLYPTLHLSRRLSEAQQLQLSYSRRVNRPDADELNPFPEYDDPTDLQAGNPNLVPEDTHSLEFGWHYERDGTSYLAVLYHRQRYNGITDVTRALDATTLLTTPENLATSRSAGFELGATRRLWERVALNLSANAYRQEIDAANLGFAARRTAAAWNAKLNTQWDLTDRLLVQVTSSYTARRLTAQGERRPYHVSSLGLRYELKDKRTAVVLTVSDVFKTLEDRTTIDTPTLRGEVVRRRSSQVIYLGFVYNFGRAGKRDPKLEFDETL